MTTPARTLLLMRHSEAGHGGGGDHARPLTDQGRRDSAAAGRWLAEHVGDLDLVVLSSATRTRQTWAEAEAAGAVAARVEPTDEVYDAGPDELLALVARLPEDASRVLVLGHAPGIPVLASVLASADGPAQARQALDRGYPTTTTCRFAVGRTWAQVGPGTVDLVDVVLPRG